MADKNLTVKIRGDNAGLSRSLRSSRDQIGRFGGFLKKFGSTFGVLGAGLVGTAAGGLAGGLSVKIFTGAIEEVDKLTKLAKQFGLTTEQVQKFKLAATLTGTNLQQLLKGFGQLSKSIVQFERDGTGPGAKVFKDLGLSADELGASFVKGPVAVLRTFGEALNKVEDPLRRSALLEELLGARNKELAVALADVGTVFANVEEQFDRLGLGLSKEQTDAVELFRDTWAEIGSIIDNKVLIAMSELAAKLQPLSDAFKALLEDVIIGGLTRIGAALRKFGQEINQLGGPAFQAFLSGSPVGRAVQAAGFGLQGAGELLEGSAGRGFDPARRFAGRGLRQAGEMTGFPLTGAALADRVEGFRIQSGLPAAGAGTINGRPLAELTTQTRRQTEILEKISTSLAGGFIVNESTGVKTAVAAP